jgi:CHAD domain-containing protein
VSETRKPPLTAIVAVGDEVSSTAPEPPVEGDHAPRPSEGLGGPRPRPLPTLRAEAASPIEREDGLDVAGRKAMWLNVQRLLKVDAALRDPDQPHDLKRYRVATRRLRAAMRAFRDAYPRRDVGDLRDRLAELATIAGAARDLDVRIADATHWALEREGDAATAIEPLVAAWRSERSAASARLGRHLVTRRHERLLHDLVAFVEGAPEERGGDARPVGLHAASLVFDAFERLLAHDRAIRWADLETLHSIRIEAKRLRYLLEFLADVLGPQGPGLVARLVAVQDHLGMLHDAAVTSDAVRAFLGASGPLSAEERTTIAAYLLDQERAVGRLRRGVGRPWRGVAGVTFARQLSRAVVPR